MNDSLRLLLVEDSRTYSQFLQGTLREMVKGDYSITAVDSLELAAQEAEAFDPDLILLDLFLPDSEGLNTLRSMKDLCPDKAIVVLTGLDDEDTALEAIRTGAQDYLFKTETNPKTLERSIRYAWERNEFEQALLRSQRLVRDLLDSIQAGIMIVDPDNHQIVDANTVAMEMFGAPGEEVLGAPCHRFISPTEPGKCPITDLGQTSDNSERILVTAQGERRHILKTVAKVVLSDQERLVESFLDITGLKEVEQELRQLSLTDELTGIANRRQFMFTAAQETRRAARYGHSLCLINVDVDQFKKVNDTLGHHAGDLVLRELTWLIGRELRDSDIFGRVGGEEFGIILLETGLEAALEVAGRLRRVVEKHRFSAEGREISCTISLGAAAYAPESDDLSSWLRRADQALYLAKEKGRNRVEALEA